MAIWLFVLIPMVIQGRPGLRKSTPVAAATRVLKRGEDAVRRRRGVGSGAHPHDPDYKPKDKHARATAAKVAAAEKAKSDVSSQDSPEAKPVVTAENKAAEKSDVPSVPVDPARTPGKVPARNRATVRTVAARMRRAVSITTTDPTADAITEVIDVVDGGAVTIVDAEIVEDKRGTKGKRTVEVTEVEVIDVEITEHLDADNSPTEKIDRVVADDSPTEKIDRVVADDSPTEQIDKVRSGEEPATLFDVDELVTASDEADSDEAGEPGDEVVDVEAEVVESDDSETAEAEIVEVEVAEADDAETSEPDVDDAEVAESEDAEIDEVEVEEAEIDDVEVNEVDEDVSDDFDDDDDDEVAESVEPSWDDVDPNELTQVMLRHPGRGGYDPEVDRVRLELKYKERQRVLLTLVVVTLLAIGSGVLFSTPGWIAAGVAGFLLVAYLVFLRRAVKNEGQIRQRRLARLEQSRRDEVERRRREFVEQPVAKAEPARRPRLRRPSGMLVVEFDDGDPIFDHLPTYHPPRMMRNDDDYRRAAV